MKKVYDRSESETSLHFTPDRTEVMDALISKFPSQPHLRGKRLKKETVVIIPIWIKSSRLGSKNLMGYLIYNQVLSGYNGGYSHGGETPVAPQVAPVPCTTSF